MKNILIDKLNKRNGHLLIGGVDVSLLKEMFGTPLYVYDQDMIENRCKTFVNALNDSGINGQIVYASKAFSCKEMYRLIGKFGIGADVVSFGELQTALSVGFDSKKIIFHGNNKSDQEIEFAIDNNIGLIVVDSYEEIDKISSYSKKCDKKINILIRVNVGVEAHTHHYIQTAKIDSKFGFSICNGDADNLVDYALRKDNINLVGFHSHIGSQIFEEKSFLLSVEKLSSFYNEMSKKYDKSFDVLNMGGGFGIQYNEDDPCLDEDFYYSIIKNICDKIKIEFSSLGLKIPFIIFEPGRSIVCDAGLTLYTVGSVKVIKGFKNYISIDGGMFDNPRYALYQAKYTAVPATKMDNDFDEIYSIAGKCCESGDLIAENCCLPKMSKGDLIAVLKTGAYNYSMASNYNRNCIPPVVFIKDKRPRLVVKGQTISQILENDL